MSERWDMVFYQQRERQEFALAEATRDPKIRAFHRSLAINYHQRALSAQLDEATQALVMTSDRDPNHADYPAGSRKFARLNA
jgi:hypothetical protein